MSQNFVDFEFYINAIVFGIVTNEIMCFLEYYSIKKVNHTDILLVFKTISRFLKIYRIKLYT